MTRRPRARGRRPDVHGRGRDPALGPRGGARARRGSASRSTRRAIRRSAPASPATSPARCATASARPRDLVLGVTLVLADGTIVNAGGKVVKNVAGYDLGKLVCGSQGRLAFIGRVSLRLHPAPAATATVVVETTDAASVVAALLALAARSERRRRPSSRPRCGSVRGRCRRRRGPGRVDCGSRRRHGGRRLGLGGVARHARRRALGRASFVARRARSVPRGSPRGRRSPGRGSRIPPDADGPRDTGVAFSRSRSACASGSTRRACWRERRPRRPPLPDERLRPLRLLPAHLPHVPPLERGDGLAARPDPADGVAPRRHDLAQPDRRRRTSTSASAAWPASRRAPRACSTRS